MRKQGTIASYGRMADLGFKTFVLATGLFVYSTNAISAQDGSLPNGRIHLDVAKIPELKRPYWKKTEKSEADRQWEAEVLERGQQEFGDDQKLASLTEADRGMDALSVFDIANASEHFNRAWILDKSNPFSYVGIASIDRLVHDYDGFDEAVTMALQTGSDNPRVLTLVAYQYAIDGRNDEALNYLHTALRLKPDFAPAREIMAHIEKSASPPDSELNDRLEVPGEIKQ